jgi:PhoH-like ATPase
MKLTDFKEVAVLDTNVLIDDPKAIFRFDEDILIVIPRAVLEELDGLKDVVRTRAQSRASSWNLDDVTEKNEGQQFMLMDNGGYLLIEGNCHDEFKTSNPDKADNRIMSVAVAYAKKGSNVIMYSNDTNVRIMTRALSTELDLYPKLKARKYSVLDKSLLEVDGGARDIVTADFIVNDCRKNGQVDYNLPYINGEHIYLTSEDNPKNVVLAQYDSLHKKIIALPDYKKGAPIWKAQNCEPVRPRDSRQTFMAHDILDENKTLHFVLSKVAGAGKNYIATACSLSLLEQEKFNRLIVIKPMIAVEGSDTGYLPGTKEEKLAPWFESFNDTMYELTNDGQSLTSDLEAKIELDVVTHMRGRSIPKSIIIIDEAQNFSEDAIKTLLTRAGEETKIILMGDLSQIDNPRLDASTCGLRIWAERARKQEGFEDSTYILLEGNFRSKLSAWASSFYE